MSKTTKQFHAEEDAKKPFAVRVIHVWQPGQNEMKCLEATVSLGGTFVHWPLAGQIRVLKGSGRLGASNTRLGMWRVHSEDLKEMRRRLAILKAGTVEFLPLASARPQ